MKIAMYAIAKNEAKHVDRWYESVKDFDEIVVVDTGSTDGTPDLLRAKGVRVEQIRFEPFRFDSARNAALSLVSEDMDYAMFMDLDETMPEGSVETLRQAITSEKDMYAVQLIFDFDENRTPRISYPREALHKRQEFYWQYPVHELMAHRDGQYKYEEVQVQVFHEPDRSKPRSQYLGLLQTAVEENPDNARCLLYLGREYMYNGEYFDAIMWLKRHLEVEKHAPFRAESAGFIADCYERMDGNMEEALDESAAWHHRAISEFPRAREPYCGLARLYFVCGQWEAAIGVIRSALLIDERPNVSMIHTDMFYQHWCYHVLASAYYNLGRLEEAKENIILAVQNASAIDSSLANDAARILGVPNDYQSISREIAESVKESLSGNEQEGAEQVSGAVS